MNNKEYIAELAQQTGYSQEDTQKLVRKAIDAMIAEFEDGEAVSIPNFGTFEVKKRMERVVVNPTTKSASWCRLSWCWVSDRLLRSRKN